MSHIALLTDFGLNDIYVGAMKAVIAKIAPEVAVIDITHDVPAQNVRNAAFLLENAYRFFPDNTIFINVVDPGVGTDRKIILIKTEKYSFIAPDNGLLSYIAQNHKVKSIFLINNSKYFLKNVSSTFHGRDIFAPIAAHLANGVPDHEMGELIKISDIQLFSTNVIHKMLDGSLKIEIIHIDRFGNLIFPVKIDTLLNIFDSPIFEINERKIIGLSDNFSSVEIGDILAYCGSSGYLEIAVRNGSASKELNVDYGAKLSISNNH